MKKATQWIQHALEEGIADSQNELAKKAGMSSAFLSMVASGSREFGNDSRRRFCAVLGITDVQFFSGPKPKSKDTG